MNEITAGAGLLACLALVAPGCSGEEAPALVLDEQSDSSAVGQIAATAGQIAFSAQSTGPLAGEVHVVAGPVEYTLRYDYAAREVIADGQGSSLDRPTHVLLRDVVESATPQLLPEPVQPGGPAPLHQQMLLASLVLLADSGGMPLERAHFALGPIEAPDIGEALGNDAVTCISRGETYAVSFDDSSGTTEGLNVTADSADCNGKCGPGCSALTPFAMWTLDCLEHDSCCEATGDPGCWTPLGQCGDEYIDAETDFLRGFDPLSTHCGG